ncbi:hypothetical protein [Microcystis aeruginosa]|uniref:Uncharacterized protein n=1 Tax=Microcystis aeruginosa NIES-4285 TaxID=2497681 RepID=A0A402DJ22_MICAE|nr:hypothetical protein [Microcystis aeruginosa]GCE62155.1 hypothetical protein MiAbB_04100 [Microcystis aeruginosa NIES-4285]
MAALAQGRLRQKQDLLVEALSGRVRPGQQFILAQLRDFQKINYSFSRIIIILGVWEVGIDGCPLLPIL